jgi:Fic family protein
VHVAAEMDKLVELHREHRAAGVAPEVESAWLHHRFTQIHPFQDGNGRVAPSQLADWRRSVTTSKPA